MRSTGLAALYLFGCCILASATMAEEVRYTGLCEASAAAVLDDSHFAIASDDSDKIRIYQRNNNAPAPKPLHHPDVSDIEASARIGDVVFWLTSHSLTGKGKDKAERKELFATKIVAGPNLVEVGSVYRGLREDIAKAMNIRDQDLTASFNIEGLASTPTGTLLVGLRGPIDKTEKGRAYVIEIKNPMSLVGIGERKDEHASVGNIHQLKLFDDSDGVGRGIRSIERVGNRYLLVGGPVPDGKTPQPRLFWWSGPDDDVVTPGPVADLSDMTPEALIAWSEHDVQIFGDNGDAVVNGKACDDKDDNQMGAWFPSLSLTID